MMQLKTFDIFTKNVQELYNELVKSIALNTEKITATSMSTVDVQQLQLDIFNKLYKYPVLELGDERPDFHTEDVEFNTAGNLIGNGFSFSSSSNTSSITQVDYFIKHNGNLDALSITEKYSKRSIRGVVMHDVINLQYHFQNSDTTVIGPLAKDQKNNIVDLLKSNNADINEFFKQKKSLFLLTIKNSIEEKIESNRKKIDDLGNF
jgi:hypothetical protein